MRAFRSKRLRTAGFRLLGNIFTCKTIRFYLFYIHDSSSFNNSFFVSQFRSDWRIRDLVESTLLSCWFVMFWKQQSLHTHRNKHNLPLLTWSTIFDLWESSQLKRSSQCWFLIIWPLLKSHTLFYLDALKWICVPGAQKQS